MLSTERASALWWRYSAPIRWMVVAVLLVLAGFSTILDGGSSQTQRATVAAVDIASGATIESSDLTTALDTLGLVTLPVDRVSGEIARGPISVGEPITSSRLTPGRVVDLPPDLVAFPLVLPDANVTDLLVSGDRIDVIAARGSPEVAEAQIVAADVEVLAVPEIGGGGIGRTGSSDPTVLIAASRPQAIALAGLKRAESISIAIR